ncbi:MAG: DapH/DapD/GlmU-related protein [Patulibacter sp.]
MIVGPGTSIDIRDTGSLRLGANVVARRDATFAIRGSLAIGDDVFLGRGVLISCFHEVTIGIGVRFGERVSIHDENHVFEPLDAVDARRSAYDVAPVTIGPRAWLGANVVVLPGVTIGADSVVGAGSVVTKDLSSGVLAAGVPCLPIRALAEARSEHPIAASSPDRA